MKPGRGRNKGNKFERDVSKIVVRAFKQFGITQVDCYRTPSSGGHRYAKHEDPGDLVISRRLRKMFPWHVECKNDKRVDLQHFYMPFSKHKKTWVEQKWLKQAEDAAALKGKGSLGRPMLVFKTNGFDQILCAVREDSPWFDHLGKRGVTYIWVGHAGWAVCAFSKVLRIAVKAAELFER